MARAARVARVVFDDMLTVGLEENPALQQPVDDWSLCNTIEVSKVVPSKIVSNHKQHVLLLGLRSRWQCSMQSHCARHDGKKAQLERHCPPWHSQTSPVAKPCLQPPAQHCRIPAVSFCVHTRSRLGCLTGHTRLHRPPSSLCADGARCQLVRQQRCDANQCHHDSAPTRECSQHWTVSAMRRCARFAVVRINDTPVTAIDQQLSLTRKPHCTPAQLA